MGDKQENKRKKYTPNEKLLLLFEVDEMCPLCGEKLIKKKEYLYFFYVKKCWHKYIEFRYCNIE